MGVVGGAKTSGWCQIKNKPLIPAALWGGLRYFVNRPCFSERRSRTHTDSLDRAGAPVRRDPDYRSGRSGFHPFSALHCITRQTPQTSWAFIPLAVKWIVYASTSAKYCDKDTNVLHNLKSFVNWQRTHGFMFLINKYGQHQYWEPQNTAEPAAWDEVQDVPPTASQVALQGGHPGQGRSPNMTQWRQEGLLQKSM